MAESKEDKIERLMREGLNHYGMGAVEEALRSWRQVLRLDPDHAEARDFVATAEEAAHAAAPPRRAKQPSAELEVHEHAAAEIASGEDDASLDELISEGQRLVREEELEAGLDLLEAVARRDPMRLEVHGHIEGVRSRLVKRYRERMGDLGGVPRL
jgi:tetratricopeptide (TPR) repeat protein